MIDFPCFPVTKLDAARRQLELAVELWFFDHDAVSIHTLASAAYQILADLSKHRGMEPMISTREGLKRFIKPGMGKKAFQMFAQAENFFKHADRDPDDSIEFRPASNEYILWEACSRYRELSGEKIPNLEVMSWWFLLSHSEHYTFPSDQLSTLGDIKVSLLPDGKQAFYRDFIAFTQKLRK
jgi:hypothetical protein